MQPSCGSSVFIVLVENGGGDQRCGAVVEWL